MAYKMTKRGSLDNEISNEFICDTIEDMNKIDNKYRTLGSIAMVISGDTGFEVYMANTNKEWTNLGITGGSESGGESNDNEQIIQGFGTMFFGGPIQNTIGTYQNLTLNNFKISGDIYIPDTNTAPYPNSMVVCTKPMSPTSLSLSNSSSFSADITLLYKIERQSNIYYVNGEAFWFTDNTLALNLYNLYTMDNSMNHFKSIVFANTKEYATELEGLISTQYNATTEEEYNQIQQQINDIIDNCIIEEYDMTEVNFLTEEEWTEKYGGGT